MTRLPERWQNMQAWRKSRLAAPAGLLKNAPWSRLFFNGGRVVLGCVWLLASYDKILNPEAFAKAVYNYQLLPDGLIYGTALFLPWLECVLGVLLISGRLLPGAIAISNGLLVVFMTAIFYNMVRGLDISCGCFSTSASESPIGVGTILRDLSFLLIALYLFVAVFMQQRPVDRYAEID